MCRAPAAKTVAVDTEEVVDLVVDEYAELNEKMEAAMNKSEEEFRKR